MIGRFTKSLSSASSVLEKSLQKQPQDTQFVSGKSGARSPSVESRVQTCVPPQAKISGNLLRSATHWLYLVELALAEKLHNVAVDLFRLAISCRAQVFCPYPWDCHVMEISLCQLWDVVGFL
jgi:hypothetical protein